MKTVIYLDELLLVNFAVGAAFLLGAGLLCGQVCRMGRLLAGAGAAAVASLSLLGAEWPFALALLYKVSSCAAVVALCYGWSGLRPFAHLCAWFVLLNLMLTGAVLLPLGAHSNNLSVYLPLSPAVLLLCCGGVYLALRGVLFCFGRAGAGSVPAQLQLADVCLRVQALYDTGFSVQEPVSGRAVVLLRFDAVRAQLPAQLRTYLEQYFAGQSALPAPELGVRFVPCSTVAGHCLLPAVPAQSLSRRVNGRSYRQRELLAAFCGEGLPSGSWTLLMGADVAQNLKV